MFCNAKADAEALAERLTDEGFPAAYMAGGRSQIDRMDTMTAARDFKLRIVVSTDLVQAF